MVVKHLIYQNSGPVGDYQLLKKSPQHQLRAKGQIRIGKGVTLIKLPCQLIVTADRALYDLREKGHKQSEFKNIRIRFEFIPI